MFWMTDIHADKKSEADVLQIIEQINEASPSYICITGDIAEHKHTVDFLNLLKSKIARPIFFVLGNHDYYQTAIEDFSSYIASLYAQTNLFYLPSYDAIALNDTTGIIGIDNWYNLSDHDFAQAEIRAQDFDQIIDVKGLKSNELISFFEQKYRENLKQLEKKLSLTLQTYDQIYVLMHVPPFHPTNFFDKETLQSAWRYYWSCDPIGKFLVEFMKGYPEKSIIILSGHTHVKGKHQPAPNIKAYVGDAAAAQLNYQLLSIPPR